MYTSIDYDLTESASIPESYNSEDLFYIKPVTCEEVGQQVIMSMPSNKAPGMDRVPIRVIKECPPEILAGYNY